ncbi:ferric reductase-like transmembrane domain-containing protein [Jannaschia sp. 2305UL9-9]|uniref:ferric reductase-like transmembrane domain-containing protein n=1 Tax=Jannaschia sp. 2305UL9-9 TaxID=3121638 RepID=UPI00352766A1
MTLRAGAIWTALILLIGWPLAVAATSPLLAWRGPVYVLAGLAGVAALALLPVQPLLIRGTLPGLGDAAGRRVHRGVGLTLVFLIVVHVAGLWITSPPDVIDALAFRSPTPFAAWGVIAMWSAFAAAALAALRRPLHLKPAIWRAAHTALAAIVVIGTIVHAVLIEGTMGTLSKTVLCGAILAVFAVTLKERRVWVPLLRRWR